MAKASAADAAKHGPLAVFLQSKQKMAGWRGERGVLASYLDVVAADLGIALPTEYRNLLLFSNGGQFYGDNDRLYFYDAKSLGEINRDRARYHLGFLETFATPPIAFGTNGQDGAYFLDRGDVFGQGAWSVLFRADADGGFRSIGRSIQEAVERIDAGLDCSTEPPLVAR